MITNTSFFLHPEFGKCLDIDGDPCTESSINFFLRWIVAGPNCCNISLIGKGSHRYPVLRVNPTGKLKLGHRVAFSLWRGKIPEGQNVCHSCDNRSCVNPNHLWAGTQKQNILDAEKKGRLHHPRQYLHLLGEMRRLRRLNFSYPEIGRELNIASATAWEYLKTYGLED